MSEFAIDRQTRTGGRAATTGVIAGRYALSVGNPNKEAPSNWAWTLLSNVARLETGHTPSRRHPEWWGGDIPWIGIRDATGNHGRTIYETRENTNQDGIDNSSARVLPTNTVCLSRTASVGYVVVMGRPMSTSQDFVNWVCSDAIDFRFLKYVLLSERDALLQYSSGTTHQTIYFPEVKAFHVCLPPRDEQTRIADVLTLLDEKIELNRRMAETLEAIARTLFKSWFVDFEPVHARAEGRSTGLPDDIASSFPSEFGGDGVPLGWSIQTVGSLYNVSGGNTPLTEKEEYWGGSHHWASPKDLSSLDAPVLLQTGRQLTNAGLAQSSSGLLPAGSLLLSSRAPIGYMAFTTVPTAINQGFAGITRNKISTAYAWAWCHAYMDVIKGNAGGSTFPEISKSVFRQLPMLKPCEPVLEIFSRLGDGLIDRMIAAVQQQNVLASLRDALLPKLISGELRIAAAEQHIAAA